jgi:RimJ/RimL family protein N-acetyltransferase
MTPVELRSARLVLDQPGEADVDEMTRLCQDPVFEAYLTIPWPYERRHAEGFVRDVVPAGWETGAECTWAIRVAEGAPLLGVIGWRNGRSDVGFWLGAEHRRHGYMAEALGTVADWLFARDVPVIRWECFAGNTASAATARAVGFRFTGEAPMEIPARDGTRPAGWHGELSPIAPRRPQPGWPIPS